MKTHSMPRRWLRLLALAVALGLGPQAWADVDEGRAIAFDRSKGNCLACHSIEGGELPGTIGPPLLMMKARFPEREVLFQRIWDQTEFNPSTVMPPFGRHRILTDDEINKVVDFLYTL